MTDRLRAAFADQAKHCAALGSPFMDRLMRHLAAHWSGDTALARRFADWPGEIGPRGASLPLRLASGLHSLVLTGQDNALTAAYPGGTGDLAAAVDAALHRHDAFLNRWCDRAPQTNEIRRSAALIAVVHWLTARLGLPLMLSELGASAGLNLMFDRYALKIGGQTFGPAEPVLCLAPDWHGPPPPSVAPRIADRRGVDLAQPPRHRWHGSGWRRMAPPRAPGCACGSGPAPMTSRLAGRASMASGSTGAARLVAAPQAARRPAP